MKNKLIAALVLVDFAALNVYAVAKEGFEPFLQMIAHPTPWQLVLFMDLVIALALCSVWMVRDARRSGRNAWPFVVVNALLGSIGTLSYLLGFEGTRVHTNSNKA